MPTGKFIRIGPDSVSTNSDTALGTIFNGKSNTNSGEIYLAYRQDPNNESSFSNFSKQRHAHYRSCMSQTFTSSALKDLEDRMLTYVSKFVDLVGNDGVPREHSTTAAGRDSEPQWSKGYDLAEWCSYMAFHVPW